jgi:hypothetical protein
MTSSTESRHLIKAESSACRVRRSISTYKDRQPLGWSARKASRDSNQGQRDAFCRVPSIGECTRPHRSNGPKERRNPFRVCHRTDWPPQVVTRLGLWQTVGMTKKREFPQHREDRKVQRLVERIVQQQALQDKAAQEKNQAPPPRS